MTSDPRKREFIVTWNGYCWYGYCPQEPNFFALSMSAADALREIKEMVNT
jgi:predicted RNase H-like HicB family nuclease